MHPRRNARIIPLVLILMLMFGMVYLYNSDNFEQTPPQISTQESFFWNLKEPIAVSLEDSSGIKSYKVILDINGKQTILDAEVYDQAEKHVDFEIKPPRFGVFDPKKGLDIRIEATDGSQWNFFKGNTASKRLNITVDQKRPNVMLLSHSYGITKGGSALVIFKADDPNLKDLYIEANDNRFLPQPFHKEGYYASLIAWPVQDESFKATIHAEDKAGNQTSRTVRLFLKDKKYRVSTITVRDSILEGKVSDLAEMYSEGRSFDTPVERFVYINEALRKANETHTYSLASDIDVQKAVDAFSITPFYPLKNAAAIASFGDHRFYNYKDQKISESYHLGLDLASVKHAPILTTNAATVKFASDAGIYGNSVLLDHGLGLHTLYSHCSEFRVNVGDTVPAGTLIAKTGTTGFSFGDHLHFGILVQGHEVRPEEWMDRQWIKLNIDDILKTARKMIDSEVS